MDHRRGDDRARLEALGVHVKTHGFEVAVTSAGLRVADPGAPGCCAQSPHRADTVTCAPRADDGGALRFFASWGHPLGRADQITDTTVAIKGYLSGGAGR